MLSLATLTVAALLAAPPATTPPPAAAPNPEWAALAAPSASEEPAVDPTLPFLSPAWHPAATCTEGSFQWEATGDCCGVGMSRTFSLQQKCVGGTWVYTGNSRCTLPICFIP